jgi:hypothetical protein
VANSSALGGALRAAHAVEQMAWSDLFSLFAVPDESLATRPNPDVRSLYDEHFERFVENLRALIGADQP